MSPDDHLIIGSAALAFGIALLPAMWAHRHGYFYMVYCTSIGCAAALIVAGMLGQ